MFKESYLPLTGPLHKNVETVFGHNGPSRGYKRYPLEKSDSQSAGIGTITATGSLFSCEFVAGIKLFSYLCRTKNEL